MPAKVEPISSDRLVLGESPHWNPADKTLYFVDAVGSALCKYVPSKNEYAKVALGKKLKVSTISVLCEPCFLFA